MIDVEGVQQIPVRSLSLPGYVQQRYNLYYDSAILRHLRQQVRLKGRKGPYYFGQISKKMNLNELFCLFTLLAPGFAISENVDRKEARSNIFMA